MKRIPLTQGRSAIVDDADYEALTAHSWCLSNCSGICYAVRGCKIEGKHHTVLMHREIMEAPKGMLVDHINGDGLDNRRCNLRLVTDSQNHFNQRKRKKVTSSKQKGFTGISVTMCGWLASRQKEKKCISAVLTMRRKWHSPIMRLH